MTVQNPTLWERARARRVLSSAVAAAVLAVAALGGVWAYGKLFPDALSCGAGLTTTRSPLSCVGVDLDGTALRKDEPAAMRALESRIKAADDQVSGPYRSVVLLLDLTPVTGVDTVTYNALYTHIEGAVTAQWEANHTGVYGSEPGVKLFLANLGSQNAGYREAVRQIKDHRDDRHIDEVVGLGQSTAETRHAAKDLSAAGIPVIGATVTADTMGLDPDAQRPVPLRDFFRLSATNKDAVAAAAQYLDSLTPPPTRVLVVRDTRESDDYTSTLGADAHSGLTAPGRTVSDLVYSSSPPPGSAQPRGKDLLNVFGQRHSEICLDDPQAVFFAGRGTDLGAFVQSLDQAGSCRLGHPVVITGDDGVESLHDPAVTDAVARGDNLYYTALGSGSAWDGTPCTAALRLNFEQFKAAFTGRPDYCTEQPVETSPRNAARLDFDPADLDGGQAMLTHDAVAAAVQAARDGSVPGSGTSVPDTYNMLIGYGCARMLPGASGWIAFNSQHDPLDPAIPLVRITAGGKVAVQHIFWARHKPLADLPKVGERPPGC